MVEIGGLEVKPCVTEIGGLEVRPWVTGLREKSARANSLVR